MCVFIRGESYYVCMCASFMFLDVRLEINFLIARVVQHVCSFL